MLESGYAAERMPLQIIRRRPCGGEDIYLDKIIGHAFLGQGQADRPDIDAIGGTEQNGMRPHGGVPRGHRAASQESRLKRRLKQCSKKS